ncbi:MAG: tyrosine-protein phosphatase [Tannerella sp.]|jgi:protein-tyrosine phosphatase|nr:tyrosine-protein phosphatase [Tannerella sp.]
MNTKNRKSFKLFAAVCLAVQFVFCCHKPVSHQRAGMMEGAPNFRDLGGYRSGEGKQTVWGKVFRTQALDRLNDRDVEKMRKMGIKTVIDFRDDDEAEKAPSRLPEGVNRVRLPIAVGNNTSDSARQMMQSLQFDSLQCIHFMEDANRQFVTDFSAQYKAFFGVLLREESYPVVFHCTAGKDRTGFAAAILLSALDVDWDTVMKDYMLTGNYLKPPRLASQMPGQFASVLRLMWSVQPSFLNAARDEIMRRYGSMDAYLEKELQVGKAEKEKLKRCLLQSND